jgi:hypothetical protein
MTIRPVVAWLLAGGVGMSAACDTISRAANAVGELVSVQQAVQARVGSGTVKIRMDGSDAMTVLVINSSLRGLPDDQRKAKARELAMAAYEAYANRTRLARVRVVFQVRASVPFVTYEDGSDAHAFEASELRDGAAAAPRKS